jgi:glycosyltransferase involved in cell wall biosynthesis
MHILQVTLGFYPAQAWGGPVKIVYQNSKELVRRGHQVTVYCTNLYDKKTKIQPGTFERDIDGIHVVYFNTWRIPFWPGTLGPIWLPELPSLLNKGIREFDIVHLNGYRSPMIFTVARSARNSDIPIIMQPHGTLQIIVNSFWAKRIYDKLFGNTELSGIHALIAGQESERQQALDHGIPSDLIEIIPNGIDSSEIDGLPEQGTFRKRLGIDMASPLILFLGRINKKKGTDMLVDAFAKINIDNAILVIAGPDDGQLTEVQSKVENLNLSKRVIFTGLLSGTDVLSAFQDADLFVLPCRTDTFPFAIVEACLLNKPMVVTEGCEITHLIKGRVAEIVPFDAQLFANAMNLLLTDHDRYEYYKRNCPIVIADTFSIQTTVDRLENVYRRAGSEKVGR